MITYKQASTIEELRQILELQQKNLRKNISQEEMHNQGFLTVEHSFELLSEMNEVCGHVIATESGNVVGYALCMHPKFKLSIPLLLPMFEEIEKAWKGPSSYMVMGQICVAKSFRGRGIFQGLYSKMKEVLPPGFDSIITEVDSENSRSMRAHYAVGFKELKTHFSEGREWHLIYLP
nr:GNAT family N-acetyltransferase [Allomuricauda sp.]